MSLHLQPVEDMVHEMASAPAVEPVFFVIQRGNGHWSPAAKIMAIFDNESLAETHAANLKDKHPQQTFGVAALRSEAQIVPDPIHIVRVPDAPQSDASA
jgi:hypothetical protein